MCAFLQHYKTLRVVQWQIVDPLSKPAIECAISLCVFDIFSHQKAIFTTFMYAPEALAKMLAVSPCMKQSVCLGCSCVR